PPDAPAPVRPALDALRAARARALRAGDATALAATCTPGAVAAQTELLARIAGVPLAEFGYRITSFTEPPPGADRLVAAAELGYRLTGTDDFPALCQRRLEFDRTADGRWLLDTEQPTGSVALWDLGAVHATDGRSCLVLGLADQATLGELAALGDRAAPAVAEVWGNGRGGRLLLELPATEEQFARLMDVPADTYKGIAAVTLAVSGAPLHTPADRILVNPDAYRELSQIGRRVVVTHEATHVATRADTKAWTPLWLSEGVADWTAYRDSGRTAHQIAPELTADVRAGRIPTALPEDTAFAAGATGIAQAYEMAWLACDLIVRRYGGQERLVALYRAVGAAGAGQLERAFRTELGVGVAEFTKQWTAEVAKL
ncbi:hypothetical protein, partial [Kitasatospora cinereorecta]